ncbi:hypothetical protein AAV35_013855 (plasmid) [Salimicrobium jeotgali]|uniref:Uncharacterized protein n=2 Tax=Salimicrobium jeotgali TaxID=1230341 RepID=A0AAC8T7A6_9BACI|nr:hypothetical protein AAV35_013855 [Salimicrobium jeotgali]
MDYLLRYQLHEKIDAVYRPMAPNFWKLNIPKHKAWGRTNTKKGDGRIACNHIFHTVIQNNSLEKVRLKSFQKLIKKANVTY